MVINIDFYFSLYINSGIRQMSIALYVIFNNKGGSFMDEKMIDFLEECEKSLINQLCFKCPELSQEQINAIVEIFSAEIDKQI